MEMKYWMSNSASRRKYEIFVSLAFNVSCVYEKVFIYLGQGHVYS